MKNTIKTSISPWISVKDGLAAVNFYKQAFGATENYRLEMPDGLVVRFSVEGAEFWVSGEIRAGSDPGIENIGENPVRLILTVSNPDDIFESALKAGATEIFPVGESHGWRLGRISDPFGIH